MTSHAFMFEAKSLQEFVFNSNRLKEIVGGSELIASLVAPAGSPSLLARVLDVLGSEKGLRFSRRSGGAFYAFSDDETVIDELAQLWTLALRQYAPDLEFVTGRGEGENDAAAFDAGRAELLADVSRRRLSGLVASPFVERNRRTGEPATSRVRPKGGEGDPEPVDAATRAKLRFATGNAQGERFNPESVADNWPLLLTPENRGDARTDRVFPFLGERRHIAVIHADGNGLGQLIRNLSTTLRERHADKFTEVFLAFSDALDQAMVESARGATRDVLESKRDANGVYPARPIVLGGEDLTVIVRADVALDFAEAFMAHFSALSEKEIGKVAKKFKLSLTPSKLTACAGIAYIRASQPFHSAYKLAESLCKHAKDVAKAQATDIVPSAVSLYRVTTSLVDDYADVILPRLRTTDDGLRFTMEAYALENDTGLPTLAQLKKLQGVLEDERLPQSFLRELLGLITQDAQQASVRYRRWREVLGKGGKAGADGASLRQDFDEALGALIEAGEDLPFGPPGDDDLRRTPLGDVNVLAHAQRA